MDTDGLVEERVRQDIVEHRRVFDAAQAHHCFGSPRRLVGYLGPKPAALMPLSEASRGGGCAWGGH
ncbi:MAG: hypothetical protein M3N47_09145 [Chloroflexota bacterium]|nr:hypothetical protein [Chloroflexota bacterium]